MNMNNVSFGLIFMAAITAIVGVILLANVADTIAPITTPFTISNDSVSLVPARLGAGAGINTTYPFTLSHTDFVTDSGVVTYANGTAMRVTTDYTYNYTTKKLFFGNSTALYTYGNLTGANYQYYDDNYVDDAGSRAVIPLILILFGVGVVLAVIVYLKRNTEEYF
jgi:hypothetical protein